jgi:hypothetical protein
VSKVNWKLEATKIAKTMGLDVKLFHALISQESGWNPNARSPVGAIGFGQLMPGTARGLGVDPYDPRQNLLGAARYLKRQLDAFGDPKLALAAYNAGPGAVQKYGGVPPYAETQRYVRSVMQMAGDTPSVAKTPVPSPTRQPRNLSAPPVFPGVGPGPATSDAGAAQAFENLGRISRGENPLHTLFDLTSTVASEVAQPDPVSFTRPELPTQPQPTPSEAPKATGQGDWGGSHNYAGTFAEVGFAHGLKAVSEKRDRKATASGGVSDHWTGSKNSYAYDLSNGSAPTKEMDAAAIEIAARLGMRYDAKRPLVLTRTINGYRVQVLYRTNVGGNHFNHIHVGVRKV